jgi:hypothetical protein
MKLLVSLLSLVLLLSAKEPSKQDLDHLFTFEVVRHGARAPLACPGCD